MPSYKQKPKLKRLFERAQAIQRADGYVTATSLCQRLRVSKQGAACLMKKRMFCSPSENSQSVRRSRL
jgi:hypothetical protein